MYSRKYCYEFLIDGQPILYPDIDVPLEGSDVDTEETGRDEGGHMHRFVLREGVKKWGFQYAVLTLEEFRYMQSLFKGKPEFEVEYRDEDGQVAHCTAYRSNYGITIHNAKTGICKNYKFNIVEC